MMMIMMMITSNKQNGNKDNNGTNKTEKTSKSDIVLSSNSCPPKTRTKTLVFPIRALSATHTR